MSKRYLKYETELENSLVDENGVLIPVGNMPTHNTAGTVIDVGDGIPNSLDTTIGDAIKDCITNGKSFVFYNSRYETYYWTPFATIRPKYTSSLSNDPYPAIECYI